MSINSVAAPIWNEIADRPQMQTDWGRKTFSMDEEQLSQQENEEYQSLMDQGIPHAVASAFLDVRHLLLERKAIAAHVRKNPDLRQALPEVNSVNEAILLALGDRPMTIPQTKQLRELLQKDLSEKSPA